MFFKFDIFKNNDMMKKNKNYRMKKILAVVLLMIGSQAYAENDFVSGNVQKIKETQNNLNFDYYYTLTHNRIYIKTMSIKTKNSIEKSKFN